MNWARDFEKFYEDNPYIELEHEEGSRAYHDSLYQESVMRDESYERQEESEGKND